MSKAKTVIKESVVYAGPSLPNNLLKQNTVFANGVLPSYLNELTKDDDFNYFLISPSKLGSFIVKLKDASSLEYSRYIRLANKLKGLK